MVVSRLRGNEDGVSVIVGTLLLILITVTAAAGLAIMVSEFQKEDMNRQSHIRNVENENLSLPYISLATNATDSGNWSTLDLTILNLNIEDSYVVAISVNGRYAKNYTYSGVEYGPNKRLLIPARKSRENVQINFTSSFGEPFYISTGEALDIRVMTSLYNTFERTFKQPTPIVHFTVGTEDLGFVDRDLLVLDGSDSFDDGAVTAWNWTIDDGSKTVPVAGNWSDSVNVTTSLVEGQKATARLDSPGPFRINLTVTDDAGMTASSHYTSIPANPMFNPATNLQVTVNGDEVNATVLDIGGRPVKGVVVNFVKAYDVYGNLTMSHWSRTTDANGAALSTKQDGAGTIRVTAAKIPPVDVSLEL
jgi:hypothetical protein